LARIRTTKKLAKRIELEYFKRSHPLRRWLRILSFGAPAIAAAWLTLLAARGDHRIYNSGPVSTAHSMFGNDCAQCHIPGAGSPMVASAMASSTQLPAGFWQRVTDTACVKCHDGPIHHDNQVFTPGCVSCHVEHKGRIPLALVSDRHCTSCHAQLETKAPAPRFERTVRGFATGHPEFRVLRTDEKDGAQINLNHEKHLKAGLRGPKGPVQMTCSDCHRASLAEERWPFSLASMGGSDKTPKGAQAIPKGQGGYMDPINYEQHCAACHRLEFDQRFVGIVAPHDKPEVVHAFLLAKFTDGPPKAQEQSEAEEEEGRSRLPGRRKGAAESEEETHGERESPRRLPGRRVRADAEEEETQEEGARARLPGRRRAEEEDSPRESVAAQVKVAERLLFKKCQECHSLKVFPDRRPVVATPAIPARWLPHSAFNHRSHRMLTCTECHVKTPTSQQTADVLLPGIKVCLQCHRDRGGARSDCVECHLYHDKTRERDVNGRFTIRTVVTGASPLADAEKERTPARR